MAFYYVITEIDTDKSHPHQNRYHVFTRAMSGKQGHTGGYTFVEGHHRPKKIKNPPSYVVRTSKSLIGNKAEYLI